MSKKAHVFWTWISIINVVIGIVNVILIICTYEGAIRLVCLYTFAFGVGFGIGLNRLAPAPPLKGLRDE